MWFMWEKRWYLWECYIQNRGKTTKGNTQNKTKLERILKWEGKIGNKYKKTRSGSIETAGDFSVIYFKWLKYDDDDDDD